MIFKNYKIILSFLLLLNTELCFSSQVNLICKNIDNDSIHKFIISPHYKVKNILPNGYEFDYIIKKESEKLLVAYFFQKNKGIIKKFTLTFNFEDNILYDEMYEGNTPEDLILKDKKTFECKNDKR